MSLIKNFVNLNFPKFLYCKKVIFLEHPFYFTIVYCYGPLYTSYLKIPKGLTISIFDNLLQLRIAPYAVWPTSGINSLYGLFYRLLLRRLQGCWAGYKKIMFLRGMGFKTFVNSAGFVLLKVGMTNKPRFFFDSFSLLMLVKRFQRILIKGLFYEETILFLQKLRAFREPDVYCGKGFFFKGQRFRLKRGKRKR